MALPAPCPRISREPEIDWRQLSAQSSHSNDRVDKIGLVDLRSDVRRLKGLSRGGASRPRRETSSSSVAIASSVERIAESLWDTIDALRNTEQVEQAEDYLILRVANWIEEEEFDLVRRIFGFAAIDCVRLLGNVYDEAADERISTYALILSLTRSLKSKLGDSWKTLHSRAYDVIRDGQGKDVAERVLAYPV